MRGLVEERLRFAEDRLAHLRSCYALEMAKTWRLRHSGRLLFMWKEICVHQSLTVELGEILKRTERTP